MTKYTIKLTFYILVYLYLYFCLYIIGYSTPIIIIIAIIAFPQVILKQN